MDEKPLRNPFRSEPDAFRLLLIVGAAVAVVVIAAKLGGAAAGGPVALILLAIAARASYTWLRISLQEREEEPAEAQE